MNNAISAALAIVGGIIGLAIVAVIVSPRAQTSSVVTSTGGALSNVITAAVAPVSQGGSIGSNSFTMPAFGGALGGLFG